MKLKVFTTQQVLTTRKYILSKCHKHHKKSLCLPIFNLENFFTENTMNCCEIPFVVKIVEEKFRKMQDNNFNKVVKFKCLKEYFQDVFPRRISKM